MWKPVFLHSQGSHGVFLACLREHKTNGEAYWGLIELPIACGTSPSHQVPCPAERDNHGGSLWDSRGDVGRFSVTCCLGATKRNIMAMGLSPVLNEGWTE